ncbi:MAG TPA: PH domain-containing protein, partial [Candidatus Nesterenkonia stercoripullorum]|nr:PH domain-containing protein [Candidatus Nesterenkonia stercoripullorum]
MSSVNRGPAEQNALTSDATTAWKRLSGRIIWVDLIISMLSVLPAVVAILLFGVDASGQMWPLIGLAAFGVLGAIFDVVRWIFTRFRVTPSHVELATGVVMRRHRSIQRDRIRSVDVEAKLRHRIARMRVVNIGAGQQAAAGESALALDALSADDARALQNELLSRVPSAEDSGLLHEPGPDVSSAGGDSVPDTGADDDGRRTAATETGEPLRVFARFEPSWVIFN